MGRVLHSSALNAAQADSPAGVSMMTCLAVLPRADRVTASPSTARRLRRSGVGHGAGGLLRHGLNGTATSRHAADRSRITSRSRDLGSGNTSRHRSVGEAHLSSVVAAASTGGVSQEEAVTLGTENARSDTLCTGSSWDCMLSALTGVEWRGLG